MVEENILEISYERVIDSKQVTLTIENCNQYGYVATEQEIGGKIYTVFYKEGNTEKDYEIPEIKDDVAITIITYEIKKTYTHIAPPCSKYQPSYADVDKEGSGRNELTGEMFRERVGHYDLLTVAWDLIPNSIEYNNWYKILTHLPPKVRLKRLTPSGNIEEGEFYRGDISTELYVFTKNYKIWKGLSTTFTQWNIEKYDDSIEPTLEEV